MIENSAQMKASHQLRSAPSKQITSQDLKANYYQKMLGTYKEKVGYLKQKNEQMKCKLLQMQLQIEQKNQQILAMASQIENQSGASERLQNNNAAILDELIEHKKTMDSLKMEEIKWKQKYDECQKINSILSSDNKIMVSQIVDLKKTIQILSQDLHDQTQVLLIEKQERKLEAHLNEGLKMQVEQLIFELKNLSRRREKQLLIDYEGQIERRMMMEPAQENQVATLRSMVDLLQQRVGSLQKQLEKSESRCRDLQGIIVDAR